jgi:CDP-paratose 2-epimerase
MRILVMGGCGFVGAAVCRGLLRHFAGVEITVFDSLKRAGAWENIAKLRSLGISVVHGDMRLASDVDAVLHDGAGSFDWVIDSAAEPSVLAGSVAGRGVNPRQLIEHNLIGTVNLLEAAARAQAGVILLSTSRVYSIREMCSLPLREQPSTLGPAFGIDVSRPLSGGASGDGITECFSTTPPVSLYGATKLASETLAWEYAHRYGTPLVINRCGVMAGAGQFGRADQGIFSWWIHAWAAGLPLRYIGFGGRGLQVRDCLHPDDLADLLAVQIRRASGIGPTRQNVSGGVKSARSLAQLSGWCTDRLGKRDVDADPENRPYDVPWIVLDHELASQRFAWRPTRTVETILEEILNHARKTPDWLARCGN